LAASCRSFTPAASDHFETEVWHSGDMAFTLICFGKGDRSSNRSLGKSCSAYHQNRRSTIALFCRYSSRFSPYVTMLMITEAPASAPHRVP